MGHVVSSPQGHGEDELPPSSPNKHKSPDEPHTLQRALHGPETAPQAMLRNRPSGVRGNTASVGIALGVRLNVTINWQAAAACSGG